MSLGVKHVVRCAKYLACLGKIGRSLAKLDREDLHSSRPIPTFKNIFFSCHVALNLPLSHNNRVDSPGSRVS